MKICGINRQSIKQHSSYLNNCVNVNVSIAIQVLFCIRYTYAIFTCMYNPCHNVFKSLLLAIHLPYRNLFTSIIYFTLQLQ